MTPGEKAVIEAAITLYQIGSVPTRAQENILRTAVHQLIFSCSECNAGGHVCPGDGNSIGHTATDCGQHEEEFEVPRRPTEEEYASLPILDPAILAPAPEWVPATFIDCLAGDRIRLGDEETDVLRSSSGIWHADTSDAWHPKAWKHTELRMELAAVPGFVQYPPNTPVEILCTPERKAVLTMQSAFPGSAVVSSDVD